MSMPKRTRCNESHHNFLDSSHSWIMLLPSSRHRKHSSAKPSSRNVVSGLMMLAAKRKQSMTRNKTTEGLSPFQEFTGYKFFTSPTKAPVCQSHHSTVGSDHNSPIESTETRDNTAVDLSSWSERDPDITMMPSRETECGLGDQGIPKEIFAFNDDISNNVPAVIHIPLIRNDSWLAGEDILSSDDEEDHSDVSCGDIGNSGPLTTSWTDSFLETEASRRFMFPPRSKHHAIQHDTTWGITTATLEESDQSRECNGDFQRGCVETVLENRDEIVEWPSDEEESTSPGNFGFLCTRSTQGDSWSQPDALPLYVSNDTESVLSARF